MAEIELVPDIEHCIETTARQEYQRLVQEFLQKGKGNPDFEEKVDLLRTFLESADFKKLRQESEAELLRGKKVRFLLQWYKGETTYQIVTAD